VDALLRREDLFAGCSQNVAAFTLSKGLPIAAIMNAAQQRGGLVVS
jgi:hypothetical protein